MLTIILLVFLLNLIAIVYFLFPPKKVNHIYGYRTSKTLQSNEIFQYANKYASRYFLLISNINSTLNLLLILLGIVIPSIAVATTIGSIAAVVILTEMKLKKFRSE